MNRLIYSIENHPQDSRVNIRNDGKCQTLAATAGTGGGNLPLVLYFNDRRRADYREADDGIAPTVVAKYGTGGGNTPIVMTTNETTDDAYIVDSHPMDSRVRIVGGGNSDRDDSPCKVRCGRSACYVSACFQNTGRGWWNQGHIAETLRTPCGGDSMKANIVLVRRN